MSSPTLSCLEHEEHKTRKTQSKENESRQLAGFPTATRLGAVALLKKVLSSFCETTLIFQSNLPCRQAAYPPLEFQSSCSNRAANAWWHAPRSQALGPSRRDC